MPRDIGTGLYHYPDGTPGNPGQTVFSTRYNTFINDLANTLNQALPINMGGTGADNPTTARTNLKVEVAGQQVTNYDTQVWENGSFWSSPGATGAPNSTSWFTGVCSMIDSGMIALHARDMIVLDPPRGYYRQKVGGPAQPWSTWQINGDEKVDVAGDVMTGNLTIAPTGSAVFKLQKSAGVNANIISGQSTTGLDRWTIYLGNFLAESGGNTGSDFSVNRCNDAGTVLDAPLSISRATGNASFSQYLTTNAFSISCQFGGSPSAAGIGCDGNLQIRSGSAGSIYLQSAGGGTTYALFGPNTTINTFVLFNTTENSPAYYHTRGVCITNLGEIKNFALAAPSIETGRSTDGNIVQFFNNSNALCGSISMGGGGTSIGFNTTSDERLKEDLKSFEAGNIVDDTNVYDFAWKSTGERSYGIIAQQAKDVYPAAVAYEKDTDWWGIDYSKYVPVILQELKALRARVAELEAKLVDKPS